MRPLPAIAFASLLVAIAPAAAAAEGDPLCIIFFEPSADFTRIDVRADLILDPDQRENLSARVDADGDGLITAEEVAAYEEASVQEFARSDDLGERKLYIDGNPPESMVVRTKLHNWTGPVEQARLGVVTEVREYEMRPAEDHAHMLSGGLYAAPVGVPRAVIETIVVSAPEGWLVWSVNHRTSAPTPEPAPREHDPEASQGEPMTPQPTYPTREPLWETQEYKQRSVQIAGFDIQREYQILFAQEGTNPFATRGGDGFFAPGPALPALVLVVIAALFLGRRR